MINERLDTMEKTQIQIVGDCTIFPENCIYFL